MCDFMNLLGLLTIAGYVLVLVLMSLLVVWEVLEKSASFWRKLRGLKQ